MNRGTHDLVFLAPDKNIEQALLGLLGRPQAIDIRAVNVEALVHPNRDPGCFHTGATVLAPFARSSAHALVVFDKAWGGAPSDDPAVLAEKVETQLRGDWAQRGRCIVIDPELENWVWSDSPHVATTLGWEGRHPGLREWLAIEGLWPLGSIKPPDPKLAYKRALRAARLADSSSIFRKLAETVSFRRCTDPAFQLLIATLREWFPLPSVGHLNS